MACVNGVDTVTGKPCSLGVTKYGAAPPGARAGAKAAGIGAPSVFNTITPVTAAEAGSTGDMADDFVIEPTDFTGLVLGSGSGSNIPSSYYDALGAARTLEANTASSKLDLDIQKANRADALAAAAEQRKGLGAQAALKYYQDQLGKYADGAIPDALGQTLEDQRNQRTDFANTTYSNLFNRLGTAYTQAGDLTNEGFANLQAYLENAPQNAYATAERATAAPAASDLAQYMASRGVEAGRVEPGLQAANAAAQGGAANYNNLLTVLAASATQANQSRQNEQAMAQRFAQAQLTAQKASQEGSLSQAQLNQLNAIQTEYNSAKLQLQRDSVARQQALEDAIAGLQVSGSLNIDTTPSTETPEERAARIAADKAAEKAAADKAAAETAASRSGAVNTLAKQVANAKSAALVTRANNFIAANPKATPAQVKAEFPQLRAAAVKATAAAKKK
jgi:hypothetical protein